MTDVSRRERHRNLLSCLSVEERESLSSQKELESPPSGSESHFMDVSGSAGW